MITETTDQQAAEKLGSQIMCGLCLFLGGFLGARYGLNVAAWSGGAWIVVAAIEFSFRLSRNKKRGANLPR